MFEFLRRKPRTTGLGLDLKPGDDHYRAYVGPPEDYDLIAAMVFNLLTSVGLRQHHRVLDIGCGSLRVGRLLIPYLNRCNYFGFEPNEWLIKDGILNEVGYDLIRIKGPTFFSKLPLSESENLNLDYAVAQSIFSHCSKGLITNWLGEASLHLKESGALFATFLVDDKDFEGDGWIYPDCAKYKPSTIASIAYDSGFRFEVIDWRHPRQTWALFSKPSYDRSFINEGVITWNNVVNQLSGA